MLKQIRRLFSKLNTTKIFIKNEEYNAVKLDYTSYACGRCDETKFPIFLYHGMMTTKESWSSVVARIAELTNRRIFNLSLRNHGKSTYTTIDGSHISLMALDLKHFMNERRVDKGILLGHSLGGRAMMELAFSNPEMVENLVVVDIGFNVPVKPLNSLYQLCKFLIEFAKKLPPTMCLNEAQKQLRTSLEQQIKDAVVIDVVTGILCKNEGKFEYSFNAEILYESLWKGRVHHLNVNDPFERQCLFVYGNAGFVVEDDFIAIKTVFPKAKFYYMNAGHYLMIEQPDHFSSIVSQFINDSQ
ncbi:hypothetical protein B4U79_17742 [Dinothrombium tinctorium]|uniref:sn-1-specific diacylglycerol lipase ABHD11 n=1 Tax=Dinothrombium tinctorium TaxID=1965070 RepID=A0A3S3NK91_9ACAR|nr:hypothetical protein B4U79_16421 [Dinothrombium tinctorium]RWS04417.1 hypothetical protein B4U79_16415 [Dinothrombium tinctorium]RWS08867.1 hypothetical protein B4U79_17742 [Dinothrombium tinctorium]